LSNFTKRAAAVTAALAAAAGGLFAVAPAADAAPAAKIVKHCLMEDGGLKCASTEAGMKAMTTQASSHVLNLWSQANYQGFGIEIWRSEGDCTAESNFAPADDDWWIPFATENGVTTRQWVSSVRKIDTGHCNWRLVGPQGNFSTEVENDWPDLRNLGSGWNNRAVRVQVD
jgi:hypothetical protein